MSFASFVESAAGRQIEPILLDAAAIRRMENYSAAGEPALLAVADQIGQRLPSLTDTQKQHVGRWVHRLLGPRGWRPVRKKRMPAGNLFATAAVYGRVHGLKRNGDPENRHAAVPHSDIASRLASARRRVSDLPVRPIGVKAFIAEKRRAAKAER